MGRQKRPATLSPRLLDSHRDLYTNLQPRIVNDGVHDLILTTADPGETFIRTNWGERRLDMCAMVKQIDKLLETDDTPETGGVARGGIKEPNAEDVQDIQVQTIDAGHNPVGRAVVIEHPIKFDRHSVIPDSDADPNDEMLEDENLLGSRVSKTRVDRSQQTNRSRVKRLCQGVDDLAIFVDRDESSLTEISEVSDLDPDKKLKRKKNKSVPQPKTTQTRGQAERGERCCEPTDPHAAFLSHALDTMLFDEHPLDQPSWISSMRKPLPHPRLTFEQNHEIYSRYDDDLQRLVVIHNNLPKVEDGEWLYGHWGGTFCVDMIPKRDNVAARGVWSLVVDGEEVVQLLDENPRDGWGEPIGWNVLLEDLDEYDHHKAEAELSVFDKARMLVSGVQKEENDSDTRREEGPGFEDGQEHESLGAWDVSYDDVGMDADDENEE